jgi:phage terminase small subunit
LSVTESADDRPLSPKRRRFVEEYLIDMNGAQAAIRAGYSAHSAKEIASELLTFPNVAAAVAARQSARSESAQVDAEYVLKGLRREAEREGDGASHSARVAAYNLLGKHLGMFVDRHEVKTTGTLEVVEEIVDARDDEASPGAG